MKIVIAGGSGMLGTVLARAFQSSGDEVVVLSRKVHAQPWRVVPWDGCSLGEWTEEIDGADAVINLAGRSVNCRYGANNRKLIMDSRVESTLAIGAGLARAKHPPQVWLQSSTATIYADRRDAANDERTGLMGGKESHVPRRWDYSIAVAKAWESAAIGVATPQTRKVLMRTAIVMSTEAGGPFPILRGLARYGLGGTVGDGGQYISWIHEADFIAAVRWLIAQESISDVVNLTSPNPLTNREFMRDLRGALGVRIAIPGPVPLLEIAAFIHRTETELLLKSRRVMPRRLSEAGFQFRYPSWKEAAKELCSRM